MYVVSYLPTYRFYSILQVNSLFTYFIFKINNSFHKKIQSSHTRFVVFRLCITFINKKQTHESLCQIVYNHTDLNACAIVFV